MMRSPSFLFAGMACLACATSPGGEPSAAAPPAPLDPVGTYSFSSVYQGEPVSGTVVIRATEGGYAGLVDPESGPPEVPIYAVTVEGQTMTVFGDAGGDDLILTLEFTGDRYTGTWMLGFEGGEISGERVPDQP